MCVYVIQLIALNDLKMMMQMGVMKVKGELEDLSFKVLDPDTFLLTRYTQTAANKAYHDAAEKVQEIINTDPILRSQNATFRLTYRIKDKYQLYLKMQRKNLRSPNDVRDALGLRIIVDIPQPRSKQQVKGKRSEVDAAEEARLAEEHEKRGRDICYYLVERLRHMVNYDFYCHCYITLDNACYLCSFHTP